MGVFCRRFCFKRLALCRPSVHSIAKLDIIISNKCFKAKDKVTNGAQRFQVECKNVKIIHTIEFINSKTIKHNEYQQNFCNRDFKYLIVIRMQKQVRRILYVL